MSTFPHKGAVSITIDRPPMETYLHARRSRIQHRHLWAVSGSFSTGTSSGGHGRRQRQIGGEIERRESN